MIDQLRGQATGLNADVSRCIQLGTKFYARLQKIGKFLNPHDGVFAEYNRLMSDAAQYFTIPVDATDDGGLHDNTRVHEVDEDDESEQKENHRESDDLLMLSMKVVSCENEPANEADNNEEEEDDKTPSNEDIPYPGRPMRPGTTNRVPISVFGAKSESTPKVSSSPLFETHQAPSLAAPTFGISSDMSDPLVKPGEPDK